MLKRFGGLLTRSMHDQPELHFFEEPAIFDKIMEMKDKKFVSRDDVISACSSLCDRASVVDEHLKKLQQWVRLKHPAKHRLYTNMQVNENVVFIGVRSLY